MDCQEIIKIAVIEMANIKSDISKMSVKELFEHYHITYSDKDRKIFSIKVDEGKYQLYFDVEKQLDSTYAIMGVVDDLIG